MRTIHFTGIFLLSIILACEEHADEPDQDQEQDQLKVTDYFPLSVGSYWVYNSYAIDSTGEEQLLSEQDTVRITGDTVINDHQYAVLHKKEHLFLSHPEKKEFYYRDSLNYIINEKGHRVLATSDVKDTLGVRYYNPEKNDSSIYSFSNIESNISPFSLPSGKFDSIINCGLHVIYNNEVDLQGKLDRYYAPNVGRILYQNIYLGQYRDEREYFETRLIDYHIASK